MNDWKKALISPSDNIRRAIQTIDLGSMQIALVVDKQKKLLGTVTDGDVRRGILKGVSLDSPVSAVMQKQPVTAHEGASRESILSILQDKQIHQMPILNARGHVVRVEVIDELISTPLKDHWVILMAGGRGERLRPLTKDRPKPLLNVGKKPILETTLETLISQGFRKFYLSVNYKNEMLRAHFGNGSQWGAEIRYLNEDKRLGTAGALGLLKTKPQKSFVVMNADLLTKINFAQLFRFHKENRAAATMCVREYDFQIPYGVVKMDHHKILGIDEKPTHRFFVNAGIYVLEPAALTLIRKGSHLDMTELFSRLMKKKKSAVAFPIREYWIDIGRLDDFQKANGEFSSVFG